MQPPSIYLQRCITQTYHLSLTPTSGTSSKPLFPRQTPSVSSETFSGTFLYLSHPRGFYWI